MHELGWNFLSSEVNRRFFYEVVQRQYTGHSRRQRRRNRGITRVGPVLFSLDDVFMDRGMQGFLHLPSVAGKLKHGAALRGAYLESVRLQPRTNRLHV